MNFTVDDFINEINEIAPLKSVKSSNSDPVWQECLDQKSGFSYYWNTKTDEVTWDTPTSFKSSKTKQSKPNSLFVPPKSAPAYPATNTLPKVNEPFKIYKIGEKSQKVEPAFSKPVSDESVTKRYSENRKSIRRKPPSSDSEDEKIVLISSYGEDSGSESEEHDEVRVPPSELKVENNEIIKHVESEEDEEDIDILSKIQKRAKELQELGGELPSNVKLINEEQINLDKPKTKPAPKAIAGFSLVAGYSDSEEESDEIKSIFLNKDPEEEKIIAHSTLFPITKPIDISDFTKQPVVTNVSKEPSEENDFNTKVFQRKRRIGINLVNTQKKAKSDLPEPFLNNSERKGLGFSSGNFYPNFKSAGLEFVKSEDTRQIQLIQESDTSSKVDKEEVENIYEILNEKLVFLSEGHKAVLPVQIMVIQIQTLFTAMKSGGLNLNYLHNWLKGTSEDLVKLEKEAAPEGWLLQWDRSEKRYYYHNVATGEGQWQYPQPDIVRCDEAMDISTTPPPCDVDRTIQVSPPLPPKIRIPSPPPPPIISKHVDLPIPEAPLAPTIESNYDPSNEPLPPGVDIPETVVFKTEDEDLVPDTKHTDTLNTALDSFYSDLAAIESISTSPKSFDDNAIEPIATPSTDQLKKKKKPKVKLVQGISMKKKGVSKLVEKWKTVQMNFDN